MGREGFKAFQLVISDENGVMPWEDGFSADDRPKQPELYLPYFGAPEDDERGGQRPPRHLH